MSPPSFFLVVFLFFVPIILNFPQFIYLLFILQAALGGFAETPCCACNVQYINNQPFIFIYSFYFLLFHQESSTNTSDPFSQSPSGKCELSKTLSLTALCVTWYFYIQTGPVSSFLMGSDIVSSSKIDSLFLWQKA